MTSLVSIPTYNERENIGELIPRVLDCLPGSDVLVVDDGSPDGTARLLRERFGGRKRVHLIERAGKMGLGSAYRRAFAWGLDRSYDRFFQMDADFSHPPERLRDLRRALDRVSVAIGSRYVPGGRITNWGLGRHLLSRGANAFARWTIGLPVHDCTSGFRGFRRGVLEAIDPGTVESEGYVFQVEMLTRVVEQGGQIEEVPFNFVDRRVGESKISRTEVVQGMKRVVRLMGRGYRAG